MDNEKLDKEKVERILAHTVESDGLTVSELRAASEELGIAGERLDQAIAAEKGEIVVPGERDLDLIMSALVGLSVSGTPKVLGRTVRARYDVGSGFIEVLATSALGSTRVVIRSDSFTRWFSTSLLSAATFGLVALFLQNVLVGAAAGAVIGLVVFSQMLQASLRAEARMRSELLAALTAIPPKDN